MRRALAVLALLLALFASDACARDKTLRVLFVGNSLTYYNDLPATFASLYRATEPGSQVQTEMLATGGGTLRERLREGKLAALLAQQHYDLVVLQEFGGWPVCPESDARCADSPTAIREATHLVRANGARALWFSTWQAIPAVQKGLSSNVQQIARELQLDMADTGAAMQRVASPLRKQLLLKDGHPAVPGTWLVAATLVNAASAQPLSQAAPKSSCGIRWQGARLSSTSLASAQAPGQPVCHGVSAAQWKLLRAAALNR